MRSPDRSRRLRSDAIKVLVVDDENSVLLDVVNLLETFRLLTVTARSSAEAIQVIGSTRIDVALIDWRLGGKDDGIILGRSLRCDSGIPFVLFSGFLNTEATGRAYKAGAADVIDKPIRPGRLLAAVRLALGYRPRTGSGAEAGSRHPGVGAVAQRWAKVALRACGAEDDPRTEPAVADAAGVSTSVFRRDCQTFSIEPRDARDLIRLLRANSLAQRDGSTLRSHLETFDPRTSKRLLERAGFLIDSRFVPLKAFFLTQRLVSPARECLRALAHLAANDHLFFLEPDDDQTGTDDA